MRLPRLVTGGAIVALLAGTAACGLQTVEPKLELRDAAKAFTSSRIVSLRLSVPSSASDIRAFAQQGDKENPDTADGTGSPSGGGMTAGDAEKLTSARIDLTFDKGAAAADPGDDAARIVVHLGTTDAAEVRVVDSTGYLRLDVDGLEKEIPDLKQGLEEARASLTGGGSDPDAATPPEALRVPAGALLDGRWVSIDTRWLQEQAKARSSGQAAGGVLADDVATKVEDLLGKAFGDNVLNVQRLDGDARLGDHLVAKANLRKVYGNVRPALSGLFSAETSGQVDKELPPVTDVPDRDAAVSFWVKDGTLTRAEFDLAQFLNTPTGHLVLRADSLPQERITAPTGAAVLDLKRIEAETGLSLEQLMAGPAVDAHGLAASVDEGIRYYAGAAGTPPSLRYLAQVRQQLAGQAPAAVIAPVGKRVQVTLDGRSVCLQLSTRADAEGTVTDGRC